MKKEYCGKTIKWINQGSAFRYREYCDRNWGQCDECKKRIAFKDGYKMKECKHKYPDVMRHYDIISESGRMIERYCYCFICKKPHCVKMRVSTFAEDSVAKMLDEKRLTLKQLSKRRREEKKRLAFKDKLEDVNRDNGD